MSVRLCRGFISALEVFHVCERYVASESLRNVAFLGADSHEERDKLYRTEVLRCPSLMLFLCERDVSMLCRAVFSKSVCLPRR